MNKNTIFKNLACTFLALLCCWQMFLAFSSFQFATLFEAFGEKHPIITFLAATKYLIPCLTFCTILIIYDIFKRKEFLILNTFLIVFSIAIATILIQLFVLSGNYTVIFEMDRTK